jgi:Flp pilus assembly protein TadD
MATQRRSARGRRDETSLRQAPAQGGHASPPSHETAAPPAVERWRDLILHAAILTLAVLWVYSPVLHPVFPADWLWDDDQLLTVNATVQHRVSPDPKAPPEHLETLAKLWFNPDGADYFPLSYTALWAQWPLFGMWPTGYHLVTVLLHLAGSLLLWRLLVVMRIPGAWLAAMIFAVHPACVESVAWVSELKNTLSLPLFLLAAINYVKFDELIGDDQTPLWGADAPPRAVRHYVLALVYFLLAMFAKTSVVMLPVVLLLYAWWKHGRVTFRNLACTAPFFLISLVLGLITIYYQWSRAIGQETILVGGIASRIASAGMSILWYMRIIFWPVNLLPIYPRWEVDPPKVWQLLAWPVIGAVGWWFWKNRAAAWPPQWGRHALFAFGFFLLMVAPVLGFVTISYMRITWAADHFIYLPMIAIVALVSAGLTVWYERAAAAERPVLLAGLAVLLAALTFLGFGYAGCWVNEDALWEHTLKHNFEAWQAHNRLGAKKFARGDVEGAHFHFQNSTRLRPDLGETHNNLGTTLSARAQMFAQRGDQGAATREMSAAIDQFAEAVRVTPHVPAIRVNLANALAAAGRFEEAAAKYRELLEMEPNNPALINNFGVALYKQGKKDESIVQFRRALELAPDLKDAKESLAVALGEKPDPSAGQQQGPPNQPQPQGQRLPPLEMNLPTSPTLGAPALP